MKKNENSKHSKGMTKLSYSGFVFFFLSQALPVYSSLLASAPLSEKVKIAPTNIKSEISRPAQRTCKTAACYRSLDVIKFEAINDLIAAKIDPMQVDQKFVLDKKFLSKIGSDSVQGFNILQELERYQYSNTMAKLLKCELTKVSTKSSFGSCWEAVKNCMLEAQIIKTRPNNQAAMASLFTMSDKGVDLLALLPANITKKERKEAIHFFMSHYRGLIGVYAPAEGANHDCSHGEGTLNGGCGDVSVTCKGRIRNNRQKVSGFCSDHFSEKYYNQKAGKKGGKMLALFMPTFDQESRNNLAKIIKFQTKHLVATYDQERKLNKTLGPAEAPFSENLNRSILSIVEASQAPGSFSVPTSPFDYAHESGAPLASAE